MPEHNAPVLRTEWLLAALRQYRWRWIGPAVGVFAIALTYAILRPNTWEASQAILIRDEATGGDSRPGRFGHVEEMKTVQETILELVKSRAVVREALATVGPAPGSHRNREWPSLHDIEKTRRAISLSAPNGAEFGQTEVFYLTVKDRNRRHALALARALFEQLEQHFQQLRNQRAGGLVVELSKTVALAEADLAEATQQLADLEKKAGPDLAELRILNESSSGESLLRRTIVAVENDMRHAQMSQQANDELLRLLNAAQETPARIVATPNRLLESQPALRRLKDGLVDAQLVTSRLLGRMSELHPEVIAASDAEAAVRQRLHRELEVSIRGVEAEQRLFERRIRTLRTKLAELQGRMNRLSEQRANYQNLLTDVGHRREILTHAYADLSEARASQAAARSASLITSLDQPQTGEYPLGPSRATVALVGAFGGMITGLGMVFLTVQPLPDRSDSFVAAKTRQPASKTSPFPSPLSELLGGFSIRQTLSKFSGRSPSPN